jgi:hypothetical protein
MKKHYVLMLAAASVLTMSRGAKADATAVTAAPGDVIVNNDQGTPGGSVGDTFLVANGHYDSYTVTNPSEPQISGGDLANYHYTFSGTITNITGNVVSYDGAYNIFYDVDGAAGYNPAANDTSISSGTAQFTATFDIPGANSAHFMGSLYQNQGPMGTYAGNFANLNDYYNSAVFTGLYVGDVGNPSTGHVSGSLVLSSTPLPASALGGMVLLGGLGLRTRRNRRCAA